MTNSFETITKCYNENKEDKSLSWLEFNTCFNDSKNIGKLFLKNRTELPVVYKMSKHIDFKNIREEKIMKILTDISEYCPHFCRLYGSIEHSVDTNYTKNKNPFIVSEKYPIITNTNLIEFIKGPTFYDYIENNKYSLKTISSFVKQLLIGYYISHRDTGFTHYDAHQSHVMAKSCSKDDVYLYILDEMSQVCIPTHGRVPIILDYSNSYINDMDNLYTSMAHTDRGFYPNKCNAMMDSRVLLVNVVNQLLRLRPNCSNTRTFYTIVRNIFNPIDINWRYGFDKTSENINKNLYMLLECSEDYEYFSSKLDIMSTLFNVPFKNKRIEIDDLKLSYKLLQKEFSKIEELIGKDHILYVYKMIVDKCKMLKTPYLRGESGTVTEFKNFVFHLLGTISKFSVPKDIRYEDVLCSVLNFADCLEGIVNKLCETQYTKKITEDKKLAVKTPLDVYGIFEVNLPHKYTFTSNTKIHIFNTVTKKREYMDKLPTELLDILNNTHPSMRGSVLYDFSKK